LQKPQPLGHWAGCCLASTTAVISGTTLWLTIAYGLGPGNWCGWTMAPIGTVVGAMSAGIPGRGLGGVDLLATLLGMSVIDKLGRRTLLLIGSVARPPVFSVFQWFEDALGDGLSCSLRVMHNTLRAESYIF